MKRNKLPISAETVFLKIYSAEEARHTLMTPSIGNAEQAKLIYSDRILKGVCSGIEEKEQDWLRRGIGHTRKCGENLLYLPKGSGYMPGVDSSKCTELYA